MTERSETKPPADAGPVDQRVRPVVYVPRAIADGERWIAGELRLRDADERPFVCTDGWECAALYDQAALDAAVAAERERCAELCDAVAADTRDDHFDAITAEECASRIRGIRSEA